METVRSRDGTAIAYQRSGNGMPLILVHGSAADHTRWAHLLSALEPHFTVYAIDRRGRGASGDAEPYAIEREFEDVAVVVNSVNQPVNLLGHSYGALCAMEAALHTPLRKLILYEPPFPVEGLQMYQPGARERLQKLQVQGDRELLVTTFFRDIVRMPEPQLAHLREEASWPARVAAAHTLVREMGDADYVFDATRFAGLSAPTLLLVGENSPPFLRKPTELLAAALPNNRVVTLPGQGHVAMSTAPQLFLREVVGFLQG